MDRLSAFNIADPATLECPYPFYRALRESSPVYQAPQTGFWILARYEDVQYALQHPELFSSKLGFRAGAPLPEVTEIYERDGYGEQVDTLVSNDPPSHTRFRALVDKAFTPERVSAMERYIAEICRTCLDAFIDAGAADIVQTYAVPIPLMVIADQLGVPRADMDKFKRWSDSSVAPLGRMISKEQAIQCAHDMVEFQHYFAAKFEAVRQNPTDDMVSALVHARLDGETPLDTRELLSILNQLLVAGNETTTNAIASGVKLLCLHPDQVALLREDAGLYNRLAEEVLRYESPVQGLFRMTTQDVVVSGVTIPKGALVNLRYGAANRDEARFEDGERFDVCRRNANRHLAFGHGIHHCIGHLLARQELRCALRELVERTEDLQLGAPESDLHHHPSMVLRGLTALPVRFSKRI